MRIFRRHYALRIYRVEGLKDLCDILTPWIDEVLDYRNPFMRQVASYHLRRFGSSSAPRKLKELTAEKLLQYEELEDLKHKVYLSIVEAYRQYDSSKGTNLINWLSWRIPYIFSCQLKVDEKEYLQFEEGMEDTEENVIEVDNNKIMFDIICNELKLSKQTKRYYRRLNATHC